MKYTPRLMMLASALALAIPFTSVHTAPVSWDGNGDPNNDGTWENGLNWSTDLIPGTGDNAQLLDVTTGTRTVTISLANPQTINQLTITQSTIGAVNELTLGANLTVSGSAAPFAITPTAGQASIVTNLGAGTTLLATNAGAITGSYAGTVNLAAGSTFRLETTSNANATLSFAGPVVSSGGNVTVSGENAFLTHGADSISTWGSGTTTTLQFSGQFGQGNFTNNGTLVQTGSTLNLDWAAGGNNQNNNRRFVNTGNWTIENSSTVAFISTTGRGISGFGNMAYNSNSGTMNVESGSSVAFDTLYSGGILNLGSNNGVVSDATVTLGTNSFANITLNNGRVVVNTSPTFADDAGVINILGNTLLGKTAGSNNTVTLNNGSATSTGSAVNVGDGSVVPVTFTIQHRNARLNNFAGNTVTVNENASLVMRGLRDGDSDTSAIITNDGVFNQSGDVTFQTNRHFGSAKTFTNTTGSTYRIEGTTATITNLPGQGPTPSDSEAITFTSAGSITGGSASDQLTYINSTGNAGRNILTMSLSTAQLTPGDGSNGLGTSSIGDLALENVNLTLTNTTTFTFDVGGTSASGLFDTLSLTGSGGVLALGTDSVLNVALVNGFTLGPDTYTIATANSVTGTFGSFLLNGAATTEYTVVYGLDSISIVTVPEPGVAALLIIGGLGVLVARRRQSIVAK